MPTRSRSRGCHHQRGQGQGPAPVTTNEVNILLPKVKKALESEVKVMPPTKIEMPTFAKIKIQIGVKVKASVTTSEIKVLLSPRSRFCYCLHH